MMNELTMLKRVVIAVLLSGLAFASFADEKQFLLKQTTYEQLTIAQDALAAEDYTKTRQVLDALLKNVKQGSYDQAVVFQNLAYLFVSTDKFSTAIKYFELALNANALPSDVEHSLLFNLGQLQLAEKKYKQGIANVEKWLKNEPNPSSDNYVLLASAYYQIKQYKQVVNYISKAIKKDKKPEESWYQMLLSAHLELKQYNAAIKVLETLITRYPQNKQYWQQLSYLYFEQKKETRAIAVSALVEKLALGDRQTVLNLVDMYRYLHVPFKAANVLKEAMDKGVVDKSFKHLEKLADSWLAAREVENAVDVLTQMTALDESGETDLKLGRVFVGVEQWQRAIEPLANSLEKLDSSETGLPHLLLGTAYFYLNKPEQAEKMFKQALQYKDYRVQAHQWLSHLAQ